MLSAHILYPPNLYTPPYLATLSHSHSPHPLATLPQFAETTWVHGNLEDSQETYGLAVNLRTLWKPTGSR